LRQSRLQETKLWLKAHSDLSVAEQSIILNAF